VFSLVMAILVGSMLLVARHIDRARLYRPGTPDGLRTRIWVLTGVPAAMFAISIPLAFLVGEYVILLWPLVYVGIAIYSRRTQRQVAAADQR
jgi:hypothetical protein